MDVCIVEPKNILGQVVSVCKRVEQLYISFSYVSGVDVSEEPYKSGVFSGGALEADVLEEQRIHQQL